MSATKNTDARVAELERQLSVSERFRNDQVEVIAALGSQLAARDEEIQRLHKESQMLCDAHVEPLERQLAASREREGRMRGLLEDMRYELHQYTEGFDVIWGRVDAALAADKEKNDE